MGGTYGVQGVNGGGCRGGGGGGGGGLSADCRVAEQQLPPPQHTAFKWGSLALHAHCTQLWNLPGSWRASNPTPWGRVTHLDKT